MELVYYRCHLDLEFVAGPSHVQIGKLYTGLIDVAAPKLRKHRPLASALLAGYSFPWTQLAHTDVLDGSTEECLTLRRKLINATDLTIRLEPSDNITQPREHPILRLEHPNFLAITPNYNFAGFHGSLILPSLKTHLCLSGRI